MAVSDWSTTAASNNAAPPNGWPEGMAPSAVNDVGRQMMADIKTFYNNTMLKDASNVLTGTTAFTITSTAPRYLLNESDAGTDEKMWVWIASGGDLFLGTRTDADGAGSNVINVTRTGTTVDSIALTATSITYNGIEIGFRGIPQNAQTGNYTCVIGDAGKHIYHASGDGAGDTYTIPANASVAYAVGTTLTFVNLDSNAVSIAITTDTLTLAGTTTTGTRTLAQNGIATAVKITSTSWLISGTGLS